MHPLTVKPCDICGDNSFPETIVTCSKCNVNREHAYCMRVYTRIIPKTWICDPCQSKGVSNSPCKVNKDIGLGTSKMQRAFKTGKVKFLQEDEAIRLSSRNVLLGSKKFISKTPFMTRTSNPPISPPKVLEKLQRNDEVHKKAITNLHASCSLLKGPPKECIRASQQPLGGVIPDKKVQTHDPQKEKAIKGAPLEAFSAKKSSPIVSSGGVPYVDAECNKSDIEKSDLQSIKKNLIFQQKFLPSSVPAWRGQFEILQTAESSKVYEGFEALPPCVVNRKAYKFSRQMPSILQLELLPALNVLTDVFQYDSPKLQDIALYFFQSKHIDRPRNNLYSISKFMNAEKSMLRSYIDGVELLVFTANQLDMESKGVIASVNTGYFMWGIFRHSKIDEVIESSSYEASWYEH